MKDVLETAAFCAGCAAFAAAILGTVGFVAAHVVAPALGFDASHHAALLNIVAGLLG